MLSKFNRGHHGREHLSAPLPGFAFFRKDPADAWVAGGAVAFGRGNNTHAATTADAAERWVP